MTCTQKKLDAHIFSIEMRSKECLNSTNCQTETPSFMAKEMPYHEKLQGIIGYGNLLRDFDPHLVNEDLGKQKSIELQSIWKNESESFREDASDKEKYEIAYRSYLQNWVTANNFMGKHLGEFGTTKFVRASIAAWKQKYARFAFALKILFTLSPKTAFRILAKRLAYQMQVFSPFSVSELNEHRMIINATPCKILETRDRNDFCLWACQNIVPAWLEAQFNVKMNPHRQGTSCTAIFEPF